MSELKSIDFFTSEELFLLAEAFSANTLFGLPDKKTLLLVQPKMMEVAQGRLKEKLLLDEEGHLTKDGYFMIQVLEAYYKAPKHICLNDLTIAFPENVEQDCVVLIPLKKSGTYQIHLMNTLQLLQLFYQGNGAVRREALENEKTFELKKMRNAERRAMEQDEISEGIQFEVFQEDTEDPLKMKWFFYEKEGKLYAIDQKNGNFYHASQYWFIKLLLKEFQIVDVEKLAENKLEVPKE